MSELYDDWVNRVMDEQAAQITELQADLASARSANKSMYERINRLECELEAQAQRHRETIRTLRVELAATLDDL